jgi:RNA polymerase sigma-70 factor (ECF subfamily)
MPTTLERIYDEHARPLFLFLLNLTRSEADTRDVLQEVFGKIAARPGMLNGVRDERGFLLRLAHNAAIDLMRRRTTREKNHAEFSTVAARLFAETANPDEACFREALAAALGELPPEQRAVAHLKLWEGATFEQIAQALGIPANTAASRYRYAIDKLRDRLRPIYEEIQ